MTLQEKLLLHDRWVRAKERERAQIRIAIPLTGLLLGAAMLGMSAGLIASLKPGDERIGRGLVAGLGILVGVPTTVLSAVILGKRVKKRRAITREIWDHAAAPALGIRF